MEPAVIGKNRRTGWIEVICGSMFSGKTEELIRRMKRARFARQKVEIYKPAIDSRFSNEEVTSHDENSIPSEPVDSAGQILLMVGNADVVGIDEAQFFDGDLVEVCRTLAGDGRRVIVAGLDQDFLGQPFEPIPQLMSIAEYVTKLHAVCVICGSPANHSQRIVADRTRVFVGATDAYEPRCRDCFDPDLGIRPTKPAEHEPQPAAATDPSVDVPSPAEPGQPTASTISDGNGYDAPAQPDGHPADGKAVAPGDPSLPPPR
ncbi:MAG: thymidine kinase [Rhodothermia bacterium]|nr:thymidine kinase [Rhodothermia bacterium]